jgi:hypothetical protein
MFAISDGGHFGGNGDVFFLEPLTDFDATNPNFGDRPPNPYLAPVARVCALNATETQPSPDELGCLADSDPEFQQDRLPMVYDEAGQFYKANLKDINFTLYPNRMYRIEIFLGNFSLEAYRDVDPDEGPATASCTDEAFCQFNSQGSGGLPIKVIIESGAACIAAGADPDLCATATLAEGGTLALQQNNETISVARVDEISGDGSATINMQECQDLRTRSSLEVGRVDLMTFGPCIEINNLDNPLEVFGTVTQCDAMDAALDAGLTLAQVERMTVHRFSADDGFTVALPHAQADACTTVGSAQGQPFELTNKERLIRLARRTWRTVGGQLRALVEPPPAWACHGGNCAGPTIFRSSFQVAQPAWMEYHGDNPGGDLGTHDVGTTVTGKVQAWDSGEFDDDPAIVLDPVYNVRLTVEVTNGSGSVTSTPIYTDANGIATFELTIGPGENTVEVSGIGVGTGGLVFAPELDGTAEVELEVGRLTFTAFGRVTLWFEPDPLVPDVINIDASTGTAEIPEFSVCAGYDGVAITDIEFIKNNGDPVDVTGLDVLPVETNDEYRAGCYTFALGDLTIDKTGAYRIVANGEFTSQKFNVKPPLKQ